MTGRSGRGRGGNAGRGGGNQNNSSGGRKGSGATRAWPTKVGLNKELESNIFDLGKQSSADLLRTTQIKIAQYIRSMYGGDIMGELDTKKEFVAPPPQYPSRTIQRQPVYENMIRLQQENNISKRQSWKVRLQAAIDESTSYSDQEELEDNMIDIDNEIVQAEYN